MKRSAVAVALFLAMLWLVAAASGADDSKDYSGLAKVQKIYVDDKFGGNADGYRFAQLFEDELRKNGFTPVNDDKDADALATGSLTFMNYTEKSGAQANVWLKDHQGHELWNSSIQAKIKPGEDSVLWVARETAKRLKDHKKKALHGGSWR